MMDRVSAAGMSARRFGDGRFIAAVEAIYDAAPDPSLWPRALQAIADCFGDVGTVLFYQRDNGELGTIVSPGLEGAQRAFGEYWAQHDFRNARAIERGFLAREDALTDRHVATAEEIETHPIYTQFLVPHGLGWFAATRISPDPRILVWITVQRAKNKGPFSEKDLRWVTRLGRHAEKSLRLSIRLLDTELANVGLGAALSRVGIGVFALDSLARAIFVNPAGERLLGRSIHIVDGRLQLGAVDECAANDALIAQTLRGEPAGLVGDPRPIILRRPAPERPLVVYVLPIARHHDQSEQFLTHTRAMVLVIEPEAGEPADPAVVRDVLGSTLGEARVAALVAAGMAPRQAAERLGITEETARTVLKRIYRKVGVSRQSELTALLERTIIGPSQK
jgi:DNA-binding CsgD family transcriptional regulator